MSNQIAAAGDAETNQQIASIMKDPKMMQALQEKLGQLEGMNSGYFDSLPKKMKDRVYACRNIQREYIQMESQFYAEVNQLEQQYYKKYEILYKKRKEIISGDYEPNEEEITHTDDEDEESEEKNSQEKENMEISEADSKNKDSELPCPFPEDVKGIPEFWATVLKSASATEVLVEECDDEILKHLRDITLTYLSSEECSSDSVTEGIIGFTLNFHFNENDFFTDNVLKKTYKLRLAPDSESVLSYEGPEIIACEGHEINWKSKDKNVTKKMIKKKQKNKKTDKTRTITQEISQESFFNYFSSIEEKLSSIPMEEGEEVDDQELYMREADYEIGHFIRERLIPRAVLYYTGELNDEDEDGSYASDERESDIEDDGNSDNDPDFEPKSATNGANQPECKQQ